MTATPPQQSAGFNIPTIDIAPYLHDPSSAAAAQIVSDVRDACMTVGFFSLVGHGIPRAVQDDLFQGAKKLFGLPLHEKLALKHPILKNRGYELIGSQSLQEDTLPDLKEGFYVGKHMPADSEQARKHPELLGENVFPPSLSPAEFQQPSEAYYNAVLGVALTVLEILAKGLPYGDDILDDFMSNNPVCVIRLLHYPPQQSQDAKQLGAGAHTDFGAITLLLQDTAGGLQVLDASTGTWHSVAPNPDAYVVNIGDMLSLWTRNIYKSATHRVINTSGRDRYSVPFFFDGNADIELRPFDGSGAGAGTGEGNRAITVEEHMLERLGTSYARVEKAQ
ncbi:2og-Fe oxygenase family protein [Coniella lustricola]|uniref:2og-Fe oxygenase family protein n=1 Tax=Coniella lustricola TaxID=2025994 RepID=A0A2T2ZZ51_9PEZI|nr:2og-Fe oxygenase family protein [Coniella lustricola]